MLAAATPLLAAGIGFLALHGFSRNELAGRTIGLAVLVLVLAELAAFPVARLLQRTICFPLIELAQTARSIALFHDYSMRVRKTGDQELHMLTDAFNEMLATIQKRAEEVERQRRRLEDEFSAGSEELRTVRAQLDQARDRAQAAGRAQGEFLAHTCHEIRTPMNGILGMTELALDTQLTTAQRSYLLTVKDSAESLLATLDGVLGAAESSFPPPKAAPNRSNRCPFELRVLVVEDHPVNQQLVSMFLAKRGHHAQVAANGREALEALACEGFDAILMDVEMPVMSGFEATRAIRRSERDSGRHIPIVAMTAYALKGDRERCLDCGMDAYITKPIRSDALLETLERTFAMQAEEQL